MGGKKKKKNDEIEEYKKQFSEIVKPLLGSESIGQDLAKEIIEKTFEKIEMASLMKRVAPYGIEAALQSTACHFFFQDRKQDDCYLEEDFEPNNLGNDCFIPNK